MKLIAPNFWQRRSIISIFLLPLSLIYFLFSRVWRRKLSYIPKAQVITVGNLSIGGSGKTPFVIHLAKLFENKKTAILTRGYKGKSIGPVMVSNNDNVYSVGDEALIHHKFAPTCVAKDRLRGIQYLEDLGYEIIITDDGMQDERFKKALTFLVVDGYKGFGNGFLLPAGPLREPITSGIKKADCIVIIGENNISLPRVNIPILKGKFIEKNHLTNKTIIAFAGIGNPNKFFLSIKNAGYNLLKTHSFGDHHIYKDAEIESLIKEAENFKAKLVTTEKDYVRVNEKFKSHIINYEVEIKWEESEALKKFILGLGII